MASRKDYYDILGIHRGATPEEIERAFRKLTRTYQFVPHPVNKTAESCIKEISEAYEILSNKEKREKYDRSEAELSPPELAWEYDSEEEEEDEDSHLEGFEDVLGKFLGAAGVTATPQSLKGRDIPCALEITFEEAMRGTIAETIVRREIPCSSCSGTGADAVGQRKICIQCGGAGQLQIGLPPATFVEKCPRCQGKGKIPSQPCPSCGGKKRRIQKEQIHFQIPPGVEDGCRIFLEGKGELGKKGELNGDLLVRIQVSKHPYFQKKEDDLHLNVPLTIWEAALGTEIDVPTLEGWERITIPAGIQDGEQLRLAGRGTPFFYGNGRGDLVIGVKIVVPPKLDKRSQEILKELRRLNPHNPREESLWVEPPKAREKKI
jgi:molecular chaperone DnaJ